MSQAAPDLTDEDLQSLRQARALLEHPSLAVKLSSFIGIPIERSASLLPHRWQTRIRDAIHGALHQALDVAVTSLGDQPPMGAHDRMHRAAGMISGAAGGLFGLPGLILELPLTTVVMLRAIADVAHSEGEDLSDPAGRLACVEVFALGGRTREDDAAEAGYYGIRLVLAHHFSMVAESVAERASMERSLPAAVSLLRGVAARFGVVVSDKAAMQAVPLFGAASGALINLMFMQHYEDVARGHFTVRRLERQYGQDAVRQAYERLGAEPGLPVAG